MLTLITIPTSKKYRAVEKAFNKIIKTKKLEVSVNIIANKEIKKINRIYRYKDKVTDVLSFQYSPALGEILIARKYRREAKKLIIHGLLHIVGYDHENSQQAKKMEQKERKIIKLC
jgi:probable rRNA maturation factor